jgi:hypothetical protein
MTQIELAYTDVINVDMLESILEQKFPGKSVSRQNWGINAPFVWIKMSFWIRVAVGVVQKKDQQKTQVFVNDNCTVGALLLLGWLAYWFFRGNHRTTVMDAVKEGIKERTNVVFMN